MNNIKIVLRKGLFFLVDEIKTDKETHMFVSADKSTCRATQTNYHKR